MDKPYHKTACCERKHHAGVEPSILTAKAFKQVPGMICQNCGDDSKHTHDCRCQSCHNAFHVIPIGIRPLGISLPSTRPVFSFRTGAFSSALAAGYGYREL